jgi:uncharacterized membrane protein YeaQ/YmgE (transglycosylase-associated protein family)
MKRHVESRWVGAALTGFGAIGFVASAFLRVQVSLGHEQWASTGNIVGWAGLVAVALLLAELRGIFGQRASRTSLPLGVVGAIVLIMIAALSDCELAHVSSHPIEKVYPALVQLRFDADSGLFLFGIVIAATVRWRT